MPVESCTQALSDVALSFGEDDNDDKEGKMVSKWLWCTHPARPHPPVWRPDAVPYVWFVSPCEHWILTSARIKCSLRWTKRDSLMISRSEIAASCCAEQTFWCSAVAGWLGLRWSCTVSLWLDLLKCLRQACLQACFCIAAVYPDSYDAKQTHVHWLVGSNSTSTMLCSNAMLPATASKCCQIATQRPWAFMHCCMCYADSILTLQEPLWHMRQRQ